MFEGSHVSVNTRSTGTVTHRQIETQPIVPTPVSGSAPVSKGRALISVSDKTGLAELVKVRFARFGISVASHNLDH